jgi:hypothetical protein
VFADETFITRTKYHRGVLLAETQTFFGAAEEGTDNCFIVAVKDRSKESLIPPLIENIRPGSIVVTDCYSAYTNLMKEHPGMLYRHIRVNHSDKTHPFKDPVTGITSNRIEGLWQRFKARHKNENGTHRSVLLSHTAEFLWRKRYADDHFYHIMRAIRSQYSKWTP